jgi:ribosomal protein S24E
VNTPKGPRNVRTVESKDAAKLLLDWCKWAELGSARRQVTAMDPDSTYEMVKAVRDVCSQVGTWKAKHEASLRASEEQAKRYEDHRAILLERIDALAADAEHWRERFQQAHITQLNNRLLNRLKTRVKAGWATLFRPSRQAIKQGALESKTPPYKGKKTRQK